MKIGIDFDDTIIAQFRVVVEILNAKFGFDMKYEDVSHWNWPSEHYPMTKQDILDVVYDFNPIHCNPTDPKVSKYFNKIAKKHYVRVITARWGKIDLAHKIYLTLQKLGIEHYESIILCGKNLKQDYGFDVIVDDNPNLASGIINSGITSPYLILFNQPWNWSVECEKYSNITRVNNWKQVYNVIKTL